VLEETAEDAKLAEEEWKRGARTAGMAQFSATPSVDLRPAATGIDIVMRYVTRAGGRLDMRNRLYGKIVELMDGVHGFQELTAVLDSENNVEARVD
jgi:hypothetical protein